LYGSRLFADNLSLSGTEGSGSRDYDCCLAGYDAFKYGRSLLTFQRLLLPPSCTLLEEAAGSSKTSLHSYLATRGRIPAESNHHNLSVSECYLYYCAVLMHWLLTYVNVETGGTEKGAGFLISVFCADN